MKNVVSIILSVVDIVRVTPRCLHLATGHNPRSWEYWRWIVHNSSLQRVALADRQPVLLYPQPAQGSPQPMSDWHGYKRPALLPQAGSNCNTIHASSGQKKPLVCSVISLDSPWDPLFWAKLLGPRFPPPAVPIYSWTWATPKMTSSNLFLNPRIIDLKTCPTEVGDVRLRRGNVKLPEDGD